jgi:polyphosphate glucokinase
MPSVKKQRPQPGKKPRKAAKASVPIATLSPTPLAPAPSPQGKVTLCIDIGGTGIKMIALDMQGMPLTERARLLTPKPAKPAAVLATIKKMLENQPHFDRVSVGFPGVVRDGVVETAVNLGTDFWRGFDLAKALTALTGKPSRVINDADLQGYGVIEGKGVEMVLTLGTGLGSALFVDGRLVPNLELGHHPFKKGKTYEERVCDAEFKRLGKREWSKRVLEALGQLIPIFNPSLIHLGGGNVEHLRAALPKIVHPFTNVDGMTGGIRLWQLE